MEMRDSPPLRVNQNMIERMFRILLERTARLSETKVVNVEVTSADSVWGTPGLVLRFQAQKPTSFPNDVMFTPFVPTPDDPQELGVDLLSAFFIAHHHGGDIEILNGTSAGFQVRLPFDPDKAVRPPLKTDCLDQLFSRYERELTD